MNFILPIHSMQSGFLQGFFSLLIKLVWKYPDPKLANTVIFSEFPLMYLPLMFAKQTAVSREVTKRYSHVNIWNMGQQTLQHNNMKYNPVLKVDVKSSKLCDGSVHSSHTMHINVGLVVYLFEIWINAIVCVSPYLISNEYPLKSMK